MHKKIPTRRCRAHSGASFVLVAFIGAVLLALTGCAPRTGDTGAEKQAVDPVLYVDRETGCHYLATGDVKALTPRMDRDGKQVCK